MVRRIVVGVDGSEGAHKAAHFALELARQTGAKVFLLMVLEPPKMIPFGPMEGFTVTRPPPDTRDLERARQVLEEIAHALPADRVERRVEIGDAPAVLLEQAETLQADLIVVGARGLSAAGRWLVGSVSDRVVHHARCPVTVVR